MTYNIKSINRNISNIHGPYIEEDYSKFTLHPLNRTPEKEDVRRLKKAIENNFIPEPIKCNELLEIMDGNHRFAVWQELSMPVLYMISDGMRMEHVPVINDNQKKRTTNTYLNYFASVEKQEHPENYHLKPYNLYKLFAKKHPFNNACIATLLCAKSIDRSWMRSFKEGTMTVYDWQEANRRADYIESMQEIIPEVWDKRSFILAIISCMDHPKWEDQRWMDQLKRLRSEMWVCSKSVQYLDRIETIYNKGRRNKVYFTRV